jgi:LysM repeat protein
MQAAPIALQTNAPTQYVVKTTDTQWDLATKYLKNPWQWSELWNNSAPAIYVGDTLTLVNTKNNAQLTVNHGRDLNNNKQPLAPLPIKSLGPFLNQSAAFSSDEFGALPYVVSLAQGVSQADKGKVIMTLGLVNPSVNQNYLVLHKKRDYINPDNIYKTLGVEADYIAMAQVIALGDPINLRLTQVDQDVQAGDRLVLPQTNPAPLQFNLQAAGKLDKPVRAQIIASLIDYAAINKYSLVALNYGSDDGAVPGQILLVTSDLSSKKPVGKQIGTLVIFRTFPQVSWAMVMQMSAQIQTLNGVQSPNN